MHPTAASLVAILESDLNASGWDNSTNLDQGRPVSQHAMSHLRNSIVKKFTNGIQSKEMEQRTLEGFIASNAACGTYVPVPLRDKVQSWDVLLWGEIQNCLYEFFHEQVEGFAFNGGPGNCDFPVLSFNTIVQGLEVGPGASLGASETDFFTKLQQSTMTYTDRRLPDLYRAAIRPSPTWSACEATRQKVYGDECVAGSRLSFVPKTHMICRSICTEPLLNMMFQKGIEAVLRKRLSKYFSIDLETQQGYNSQLAQLGSLTGGFATIDLKSASDTIALSLTRSLIDSKNHYWLELARSANTVLPDGTIVPLNMVSSMGNAFTFPLQTAIFAAVVHACYRLSGIIPVGARGSIPGNFAVYGDDIIVDVRVYHRVVYALELLGFTVNMEKSFHSGGFRESCGTDYFGGHNIRGVYLQQLLKDEDFYSAINRLIRWSLQWVPLPRTLSFLGRFVRFLPVPPEASDIAGIHVPVSLAPEFTRGPTARKAKTLLKQGLYLYRYKHVVPRSRDMRGMGDRGENPDGLLLTVLAGRLRNGRIFLRSTEVKTVLRWSSTSRWGWSTTQGYQADPVRDKDWETLIAAVRNSQLSG